MADWEGFTWPRCPVCQERLCPSAQGEWECVSDHAIKAARETNLAALPVHIIEPMQGPHIVVVNDNNWDN